MGHTTGLKNWYRRRAAYRSPMPPRRTWEGARPVIDLTSRQQWRVSIADSDLDFANSLANGFEFESSYWDVEEQRWKPGVFLPHPPRGELIHVDTSMTHDWTVQSSWEFDGTATARWRPVFYSPRVTFTSI